MADNKNDLNIGANLLGGAQFVDLQKVLKTSVDTLERMTLEVGRVRKVFRELTTEAAKFDKLAMSFGTSRGAMLREISGGGASASFSNAETAGAIARENAKDFARLAKFTNAEFRNYLNVVKADTTRAVKELLGSRQSTPGKTTNEIQNQLKATEIQLALRKQALAGIAMSPADMKTVQKDIALITADQARLNVALEEMNQKRRAAVSIQKQSLALSEKMALKESQIAAATKGGGTPLELARLNLSKQDLLIKKMMIESEGRITAQIKEQIAIKQRLVATAKQLAQQESQRARIAAREDLTSGAGLASLFKVQAGLMVNFLLMNQVFNLFNFGKQYVVELDKAFRDLQAIADVTDTTMEDLKQTIIETSQETRFSAIEVAKAATVMAQAGLSADQINKSIGAVTLLATATGTDLTQSVEVSTSIMSIWNMRAEEMTHIANVLTGALNLSKLTIDKIALGIQYAGNIAADSGASFEETVAALGAIANAGIKSGSTIGTGLRQLLTEFLEPSEKLLKVLNELGVSVDKIDVRSQGLTGVFKNLAEAGFTTSEAFKALDIRAAASFAAFAKNIDLAESMEQGFLLTNAAAKANEVQMKSFSNILANFTNVMGVAIAEGLQPFQDLLGAVLSGLASVFKVLNPGVIAGLTGGIVVLGTALAGLKIFDLIKHLLTLSSGVSALTVVMNPWILALTAAGAALGFLWANMDNGASAIDKMRAELEEATGTFTEQQERVSSVDTAINKLIGRYDMLSKNGDSLQTAALELQIQFGDLGFSFDKNGRSVDGLIDSMRSLRTELQGAASDSARLVATKQAELLQAAAVRLRSLTPSGQSFFQRAVNYEGNQGPLAQLASRNSGVASALGARSGLNDALSSFANVDPTKITAGQASDLSKKALDTRAALDRVLTTLSTEYQKTKSILANPASTNREIQRAKNDLFEIEKLRNVYESQKGALSVVHESLITTYTALKNAVSEESKNTPAVAMVQTYIEDTKLEIEALQRSLTDNTVSEKDKAANKKKIEELLNNLTSLTVESLIRNIGGAFADIFRTKGAFEAKAAVEQALPGLQTTATGVSVDQNNAAEKAYEQLEMAYTNLVKKHDMLIEAAGRAAEQAAGAIRNKINALDFIAQETTGMNGGLNGRYTDAELLVFEQRKKQLQTEELRMRKQALEAQLGAMGNAYGERSGEAQALSRQQGTDATRAKQVEVDKALLQLQDQMVKKKQELVDVSNQLASATGEETEAHLTLNEQLAAVLSNYVKQKELQNDIMLNINRLATEVLDNAGNAFGDFFSSVVTGTESAGNAFKKMAGSIIKSMLDIVNKALASQILSSIFGGLGSMIGGDFGAALDFQSILSRNSGGPVRAAMGKSISTRDSVHVLARPGEFIMRNAAVDAIGVENLEAMNTFGNRKIQTSRMAPMEKPADKKSTTLNVYVVQPEAKPTMGPNDVIAVVGDNVARGGELKKLIKQVQVQ